MSNDTTKGSPQGNMYKILNMKKKTGNNLICKNRSNLQLFKSHIFVGTNLSTKYNLISILLQSKPRTQFQKKKTLQSTRLKPQTTSGFIFFN